jgi:hypothetical protein
MLKKILLLLVLFLVLPAPITTAETKLEITPFWGYRLGGDFQDLASGAEIDIEESSSYGIILDIPLSGEGQLEILWSRQETELDSGGFLTTNPLFNIDLDYLHVGGVYNWGYDDDKVRPFLLGSLGVTLFRPEPDELGSETQFSAGIGGGVKLFAGENIGFRFEGRGYTTFLNTDADAIFCGPGGCFIGVSSDILWQFEARVGLILAF